MSLARGLVLAAALLGGAGDLPAAVAVTPSVTTVGSELQVAVTNAGDEPAEAVVPEVSYRHRLFEGDGVTLPPGGRREWQFALDAPPAGGVAAAVVRVRYREPDGRGALSPAVTLVAAADAGPELVDATLEASPVADRGTARLHLENRHTELVAGRVVIVLPAGLRTDPQAFPAQVPAGGHAILPIQLERDGATAGSAPTIFAVFEYAASGSSRAVVARVAPTIGAHPRRTLPLMIGLLALGTAGGVLALAWRKAAQRAG